MLLPSSGPCYVLREGPVPWLARLGHGACARIGVSCPVFLRSLTRTAGSHLPEAPVPSVHCQLHISVPVPPSPHSGKRLWGPRTTVGTGEAHDQLGTWGCWFPFGTAHIYISFSSRAPSLPKGRLPSLTARRALFVSLWHSRLSACAGRCSACNTSSLAETVRCLRPGWDMSEPCSLQSSERLSVVGAHENRAAVITLSMSTTWGLNPERFLVSF